MMGQFGIGFCLGGIAMFLAIIFSTDKSLERIKQQASDRGYMVECVGKTGYYWECAK